MAVNSDASVVDASESGRNPRSVLQFLNSNKRIVVLVLFLAALCLMFWGGSRYPELNAKALMGGDANLEDPLSFEVIFPVDGSDQAWKQIIFITANWINTNKKGMAFGLLMGAVFLSMLKLLRKRSYQSGFNNTLLGMVMGAPLGVCVNCAAPIAKGIHEGGARLETTLAAMFSAPTLNIVALTMMFSIFPTYLAVTKLAFTLLFILICLPLLCRYVFREETLASAESSVCPIPELERISPSENWGVALSGAGAEFARSAWYLIRKTVPLMIVAGFFGAVVTTMLPLRDIVQGANGIAGLMLVAGVGIFLPVPIAFDVVLCAGLLAAGMPVVYVATLLFTLGIYSVYSFFIVSNTISKRVASVLAAVLVAIGMISGISAHLYHTRQLAQVLASIESESVEVTEHTSVDIGTAAPTTAPPGGITFTAGTPILSVSHLDYQPRSPAGEKPFSRVTADSIGLHRPNLFSIADFWPPFYNGRGIAGGDFDNDGWVDIALATGEGLRLFRNRGERGFTPVPIDIPDLEKLNVFMVAFVDLNNDGWLDLYLTSYRDGNYYILSDTGRFTERDLIKAPNDGQILTYAAAFGDIDRDGDLDAVLGNWFYGYAKPIPPSLAQNRIHYNSGGTFEPRDLPGMTGETLSTLLSDFNHDGALDLVVGNDFVQPDIYYLGDGRGEFDQFTRGGGIPVSTTTTMSVDSADINNDLRLDLYVAQIAARATGQATRLKIRPLDRYCEDVADEVERGLCKANISAKRFYRFGARHQDTDVRHCGSLDAERERRACTGMMVLKTAIRERDPSVCEHIPKDAERTSFLCSNYFEPPVEPFQEAYAQSVPQIRNANVLLVAKGDGRFTNQARSMGVQTTGWSWNAKIADLDNDEWQDIYVVNGTWLRARASPSNVYFSNQKGERFEERTQAFGLADYMIVSAYVYADIDNDGDLDIITNSINGPVKFYRNNEQYGHSISIVLRDERGNRFGIGAKVIIKYGEAGERRQIRELKSGGGFLSFDPYVLHFGLGEYDEVRSVEVQWPTGEPSVLQGPFPAQARYTITRG